jgi:hypothetical protein
MQSKPFVLDILSHDTHLLEPVHGLAELLSQVWHLARPPDVNSPFWQSAQPVARVLFEEVPAGHSKHADIPSALLKVPGTQSKQSEERTRLVYLPTSQGVHCIAPSVA